MKSRANALNGQDFHKANEFGFTLIEVVLVMVFLGISLLATMNMMSTSFSKSMDMEILATANNLANQKMEQIFTDKRSKGYAFIASQNYPPETNASGASGFNRYVTITTETTSKKVEVRITHASTGDFVLTSYLANY